MYLDLDIAIQPRNGDSYPFSLHAPGGDARGAFVFPEDRAFQELIARLLTLNTDETALTELGRTLFAALFQGQAREVLARTQGMLAEGQRLRIRLSIAAEEGKVAALPWELLDDPDSGPLVLCDTPIVRYLPVSVRVPTASAPLPLKVLLTGAPTETISVAQVLEEVQTALGTLGHHAQITVEPNLTLPVFQRRLREGFHVWHFVGQGGTSENGQSGVLLFGDGGRGTKAVSASQLAVLLGSSGVRLVVLDASAGTRLATDPFRTIAPALMKTQIPTVVAMQFGTLEASQAFAGEFYRALAEGMPIDACVTEGRRAVMGVAGLERPDWATPVVYSRAPDSQLISVPRADIAGRIVTMGGSANMPSSTSVTVNSAFGTLLNAGTRPAIERLSEKPRPPRPVRGFLNRERELRALATELQPRQGAWLRGPVGVGISALLRQVANSEAAKTLADGVVVLNSSFEPADADDAVQEIFDRFYTSNVPTKIAPDAARTHLGGLRALFILDHLALPADQLSRLADVLAESAVLIAAEGRAPDTLLDLSLGAMPRQEATKLLGSEAELDIDLSNVMFLDRICVALGDLPLPLQLAGRLLRTHSVPLKQLVAVAEERSDEQIPLARAATFSLSVLDDAERNVLAAVVRSGPAGINTEAAAAISGVQSPQLDSALDRLCELRLIDGGGDCFSPTTRGLARVLDRLLKPGDEKRRAAAFFVGAAAAHAGDLAWLAQEQENLTHAIETLLAENKANEAGALIKALQPLAVLKGKWGLWARLITWAERAATVGNNSSLRAWAEHERGTRAAVLGERAAAETHLSRARQLREQLGDREGAAATTHNMRHAGLLPALVAAEANNRSNVPWRRITGGLLVLAVVALAVLLWPSISRGVGGSGGESTPTAVALMLSVPTSPPLPPATATRSPTSTSIPSPTPLPTAANSPLPTTAPLLCRVSAARLNLRAGPGTNYAVIATLTDGAEVTPVGRSAERRWVRVVAAQNQTGWVASDPALLACNGDLTSLDVAPAPASPAPTGRARATPRPTTRPTRTPTVTPDSPTPEPTPSSTPLIIPILKSTPTPTVAPTATSTFTPIPTPTPSPLPPKPTETPTVFVEAPASLPTNTSLPTATQPLTVTLGTPTDTPLPPIAPPTPTP